MIHVAQHSFINAWNNCKKETPREVLRSLRRTAALRLAFLFVGIMRVLMAEV